MATRKVVLMTGSSSGIGLATAVRLAKDPDKRFLVIATVISFAEQDDLVATVGEALNNTVFIKELDVTKDDQIQRVVDEVVKEHGRIDILLNIAGIAFGGLVETMTRDQIDLTFAINTIGVIRLTQAVLPHMKQRRGGKIIAVTSMGGRTGTSYLDIYIASKFAVEGFMESVAPLARQFNIWVSMIEPAWINTNLADGIFIQLKASIANKSVSDEDRQFARSWMDNQTATQWGTVADVTNKLLEAINADKPVLRCQVPSDALQGSTGECFCDFTGEKLVALQENVLLGKGQENV